MNESERSVLVYFFDAVRVARPDQYTSLLAIIANRPGSDQWRRRVERLVDAHLHERLADECAIMREELR